MRVPHIFHSVLSPDELRRLIKAAGDSKHQTALSVAYGAGLGGAHAQLKEHGASAGFVFRSRALAEDLLPDLYGIAEGPVIDPTPRHRILESLARHALLDPAAKRPLATLFRPLALAL